MKKNYMISTYYANYQLYCTEEDAKQKFAYFCKLQCDVSLYERTVDGCREIMEYRK